MAALSVAAGTMEQLDRMFIIGSKADVALKEAEALMAAGARAGDQQLTVLGLCKAGDALGLQDKPQEAMEKLRAAKELCEDIGFEPGEAAVNYAMARLHARFSGKDEELLDKALDYATDALATFRSLGSRRGEAAALMTIGDVHSISKEQTKALQYAKEALAVYQEIGDQSATAWMQLKLAEDHLLKPDARRAAGAIRKAISLYQELKSTEDEALSWHFLGQVEAFAQDWLKSVEASTKARELFRSLRDYKGEEKVMNHLVQVHLQREQHAEAVQLAKEIVTLNHESGDRKAEAEALLSLGQVLLQRNEHEKAFKAQTPTATTTISSLWRGSTITAIMVSQ
ncbi:unnamed protein product [Polarella glacialis]|uniref:MalT-like TPR region domain-containing protein n=1 Tax=Polarella glacialis TaxID=89957 RepID=A0A813F9A1_POLGL|nr:unnamed protein product [Polarella glacialis]